MTPGAGRRRHRPIRAVPAAIALAFLVLAPVPRLAAQGLGAYEIAPAPSGEIPVPAPFDSVPLQDPDDPLAIPGEAPGSEFQSAEPIVSQDLDALPDPVKRTRQLIMDAARRGDFEALRPLIGTGEDTTQLSLGGFDGDPIAFLKTLGGDPDGYEILAILLEVLERGYAISDPGTPNEIYVWPYFVAVNLDELDPAQKVDLFKLVTSGDFADMKDFGSYIFYRVGITPDGRWRFFVSGD